jgi:hypothetical protein
VTFPGSDLKKSNFPDMKKIILFLFVSLNLIQQGITQENFNFPSEFQVKDKQSYTGSTLYGRIDGGAELFLEYGFERLDYFLIENKGKEYNLEIYKMKDPFSAYGIFSIRKFRCIDNKDLNSKYYCQTAHQLSVCRAEYYLTIANDDGSAESMSQSITIAEDALANIPPLCLNVPVFNDLFFFSSQSLPILIMGNLGFQNGLPEWESFFEGFSGYSCFYQEGNLDGKKVEFFQVDFSSQEEALRFCKSKGWDTGKKQQESANKAYLISSGNRLIFAIGNVRPLEQ